MFAPFRCLTALSTTSLCLAVGCMGGQSGDDGDFDPGGGVPKPTAPGLPEECGTPDEMRPVEASEETVLGLTPEQMVAGLEQPTMPFHWVEYSSTNLSATHMPGPGASSLDLAFTLRSNPADLAPEESIKERVTTGDAGGDPCGNLVVTPVWVQLSTADGALNARVKGQLTFYGARTALLYARLRPADLGGTFHLDTPVSKTPDQVWTLSAFTLSATVWNGGSQGMLSPEFRAESNVATGGGAAVSPPPNPTPDAGPNAIAVPSSWEAVGVWPRLEQCLPGVAIDMDDAILGRSPREILSALGTRTEFTLGVRTNLITSNAFDTLDVELTTTLPDGLVCVNPTPYTGALDITVPAHLRSTGADAVVALDADLRLTVRGHVALEDPNAELTNVHFKRTIEDVVPFLDRERFESATGVDLTGAPAEYTQVWWTWFGHITPTDAGWRRRASLVVTSPNAQQTAAAEEQLSEGGPGFAFSLDETGQQLPGDTLLEATLEIER